MTTTPTARQLEALAGLARFGSFAFRYDGKPDGAKAGASLSNLRTNLLNRDWISDREPHLGGLTPKGAEVLANNVTRLPERYARAILVAAVKAGSEATQRQSAHYAATVEKNLERAKRRTAREAELREKIPARVVELAAEHGLSLVFSPAVGDAVTDDVLVALWRAIVDADAAL